MQSVIEVSNLHKKRYGDVLAVDDISLTVARGDIFGIVRPNGACNSTTVETNAPPTQADGSAHNRHHGVGARGYHAGHLMRLLKRKLRQRNSTGSTNQPPRE